MFKNIADLTKIFLISAFSGGSNGKKKNGIGRIVLYVLLFAYLAGVFGFLSYEMLTGLITLHQEDAFVGIVLMAIVTLTLFVTLISTLNVLYFSKDNAFVLPLPLRPVEVLSAKLNTLLVYAYMEEAMLGVAPLFMYGWMTGKNILYYLFAFLVLLVLPVVPLLLAAAIVIVIMAFTKGVRNKSLVQTVTMALSILFSLVISMTSSSMNSEENVMELMNKANSLVEVYKKAFVTLPLAIDALTKQKILSLILLVVLSVLVYGVVCVVIPKLYYRGMLGSLYSSSGVSDKKLDERNAFRSGGLMTSYVAKELRTYLRKPTFFVQLILPCLILPAFTVGITYYSIISSGGKEIMDGLKTIYADREFSVYVYAVLLLAVMFISMYSFIPMVAISKDGHDAYAMKYLPIPFRRQLLCKMIPDILMCLFSYLSVALLGMILFKVPVKYLLMSFPVAVLYSVLHSFLILSDVRKPKLSWTNEIQIVKRNLRTMLGLAFAFLNMGLIAVLTFLLKVDEWKLMIGLILLYGAADCLLYRYIRKKDIALADGFE